MATEMISKVWPEWQVEQTLGKGSYGTVYKAVRSDSNLCSYAAIKVISIPTDPSELASLRSEGLTEEGTRTYFQGIVNDFVSEIRLMEALKGTQNIVSVEDYKVVERQGEIGWDIYIRMELLTPFNTYLVDKQMSEQEVLQLGMDICSALEICKRRKIVHRDIKPENIFVNSFGDFKLGDFGIARTLENASGGLSQKGTFNYMAPEIAAGRNYDARVDIYSLGIVLYRLLNGNRLPFIENDQQLLNPNARKVAVDRRMRGEQFVPPCDASAAAASVIMQACAYSPQARFEDATAMKKALQQVLDGTYVVEDLDLDKTVAVRPAAGSVGTAPIASQSAAPQVQGWNQVPVQPVQPVQPVKPVQPVQPVKPVQPVQPVRPVNVTTPPVYTAPVNTTTPPVYTQPMNTTTPPVYTQPMNATTPPVYTQPMNTTTPPVYTQPMNATTPPVYTQPMNTTTPPVYTQPMNTVVPPAAKAAKGKWCINYFIALAAAILGALVVDSSPEATLAAGLAAVACCIVGCLQSKGKSRGIVFGVIALVAATLDLGDGLGYIFADGFDIMTGERDIYNEDMCMLGVAIGVISLVVLLVLHFKSKKKEG